MNSGFKGKNMNENLKKIILCLFAFIFAFAVGYLIFTSDLEHIEDTNGSGDYSLTVIKDEDIINSEMGYFNLNRSEEIFAQGLYRYHSSKFTGVKEIGYSDYLFASNAVINITSFTVNEGNFKMAVVKDGEIIAEIEPGTVTGCELGDIKGEVRLIIAGESADFSFYINKYELSHFYEN